MAKPIAALILSAFSFFLSFAVGEPLTYRFGDTGLIPTLVILAAYFFVCQFFLSRGNPAVFRKNWPSMLALNFVPLVLVIIIGVQWENHGAVFWTQGLGFLASSLGGTLAGALAAALAARRKRRLPLE
jgi:cell division protein FtsW (lipid II flippase)